MAAVEAPPADRVDTGAPLPRGDGFGPYLVALARRGWRQLTSMRTALVLLFLLAVAAIPGSLLPQRSLNIEKVNTYLRTHGALGRTLDRFWMFDVFSSPWFSAIYLLWAYQRVFQGPPKVPHAERRSLWKDLSFRELAAVVPQKRTFAPDEHDRRARSDIHQ